MMSCSAEFNFNGIIDVHLLIVRQQDDMYRIDLDVGKDIAEIDELRLQCLDIRTKIVPERRTLCV
jgi:hypothetical protein